jgi:hypothetical protein
MQLTCRECRDLFSLFFDQELNTRDKGQVKEHLEQCAVCAAEWQEFKNTVQFLHDMPMLSAPADLLPGINAKLTPPGLFDRISRWLGFSQPKAALTTILATFVVGIVCASLVYLPTRTEQQTDLYRINSAQNNSTSIQPQATEPENFYPGIPSLAEYVPDDSDGRLYQSSIVRTAGRISPIPLVSQVSTGGNRNISSSSLLSSFSPPANACRQCRPDVTITVKDNSRQNDFLRQLSNSGKWQCEIIGDKSVLLAMPPSHLVMLRHVLEQQKLSYVQMSRPGTPKKMLRVAIISEN